MVGSIYRHLCMEVTEFNDVFILNILGKISYGNKEIILMGDFNIDILKYVTNRNSSTFLNNTYENLLLPYILSPARVTPSLQKLIDNAFSNIIVEDITSSNIRTTILITKYNLYY